MTFRTQSWMKKQLNKFCLFCEPPFPLGHTTLPNHQPQTHNKNWWMRVPASLVTTKPLDQGIPPPPPPRGLMLPTKRGLQARSTEHLTEALKEVMLELEPTAPRMKKYRKYLQKQNTDDNDITTTRM